MSDKSSLFKWYVVRAVSGQENKIKTYIENEIKKFFNYSTEHRI